MVLAWSADFQSRNIDILRCYMLLICALPETIKEPASRHISNRLRGNQSVSKFVFVPYGDHHSLVTITSLCKPSHPHFPDTSLMVFERFAFWLDRGKYHIGEQNELNEMQLGCK